MESVLNAQKNWILRQNSLRIIGKEMHVKTAGGGFYGSGFLRESAKELLWGTIWT